MEGLTRGEMENEQPENKKNVIRKVLKFIQDGCGCSRGLSGIQCSSQFVQEAILNNLYNCLELTHAELDLVVLSNIQAFTPIEETRQKRKRNPPFAFLYQSRPLCKDMFLSLYGISKSWFQRLLDHWQNHGISVRTHGSSKRLLHNTLPCF